MEMGNEVGKRAHLLFPGGVLVAEEHWRHVEAMRRTRELIQDANVPAIFEAAFEHEGVRIRVDVLERLGDGRFGLREVKASGSVKEHHLDDLAVQCFVLEGCGLPMGSAELVHVNRDYVRGEGEIDWPRFFAREGCAAQVASRLPAMQGQLDAMHALLARDAAPAIEPGRQCKQPLRLRVLAALHPQQASATGSNTCPACTRRSGKRCARPATSGSPCSRPTWR